jgi:YegS/Rv2252/BmrU family lipid kinase
MSTLRIDTIRRYRSLLFIVNPTSKNGAGATIPALIETTMHDVEAVMPELSYQIALTDDARHATEIAAAAGAFDLVIASGGDGVIHEVVNGLMRIPQERRPPLGIIAVGTGNDFRRAVRMDPNPSAALTQLLDADIMTIDVGRCNDRYYVQTLSFGLDAAIALDTVERRQRTGHTGTAVFLESGVDVLLHHLDSHRYTYTLIDAQGQERSGQDDAYILAVQNGRTYGGGFVITPNADPSDGLLDVCVATGPLKAASSLFVFLVAKFGLHTRFKQIHISRVRALSLHFDEQPPAQIDGELLTGTDFHITLIPQALQVLVPHR